MIITDIKNKKLPNSPGVYFFRGLQRRILYIGKAGSLHDRVRSYFNKDIASSRSPLIIAMIDESRDVTFQKTDSVLEALILEAQLIKKHQPKYNIREKDDKSFNYVVITDEDFPRVLIIRDRELNLKHKNYKLKTVFGPFPHGGVLKEALSIVRKIFPFRDKCLPLLAHMGAHTAVPKRHSHILENVRMSHGKEKLSLRGKPCFNKQIGLCSGVCTGEINKKEYQKIIRNIKLLFAGKKRTLITKLKQEMKKFAQEKRFEKAAKTRNTIFALKHIQDISLIKSTLSKVQPLITRIEGYDIAHMGGKDMVGVMVVLKEGEPQKSEYRKFNIRTVVKANDTAALKEVIERRIGHDEWPLPKLIVVDGGKAQINVANKTLSHYGISIPIVGVVKDERHNPKEIIGEKKYKKDFEKEILIANNEAHRFAIAFHKKKRREHFS